MQTVFSKILKTNEKLQTLLKIESKF